MSLSMAKLSAPAVGVPKIDFIGDLEPRIDKDIFIQGSRLVETSITKLITS